MLISKKKGVIEKSLLFWINQHPESFNPYDNERFFIFLNNVCHYGGRSKFKDPYYVQDYILKEKPEFDREKLDKFIFAFELILEFHQYKKK